MSGGGEKILEVRGLWKRFGRSMGAKRRHVIRDCARALMGRGDDMSDLRDKQFWALQDVNFDLRSGEALGLIGLNGAGKSTLLSIVARQLLPDRGLVRSRGEIRAMINLSAGLQDTLTGRDNILLKAALEGFSRKDIEAKLEDIIAFAELGEVIDAPVATYSSGMRLRLGFSVAVHTNPKLLLIDEALAVGDFRFRQKCLMRLRELRKSAAFVLVSHSFQDISRFCDRVLLLEGGRLVFDGPAEEGLVLYQQRRSAGTGGDELPSAQAMIGEFYDNRDAVGDVGFDWVDEAGSPVESLKQGEGGGLRIRFTLRQPVVKLNIGVPIFNTQGQMLTALGTEIAPLPVQPEPGKPFEILMRLPRITLTPGVYAAALTLLDRGEFLYRGPSPRLEVTASRARSLGLFTHEFEWAASGPERTGAGA
jgi:lipopolysaccharide transport system ATP-binding protein